MFLVLPGSEAMQHQKNLCPETTTLSPRSFSFGNIQRSKFLKKRVFDPSFFEEERKNSDRTIVFDLDETLASNNSYSSRYILRPGVEAMLSQFKKSGFRLVLWTGSPADEVMEKFFGIYPSLYDPFDWVITLENFAYPSDEELETAYSKKLLAAIRAYYRRYSRPKDISLPGYALIIDNNPEIVPASANTPNGPVKSYLIQPFEPTFHVARKDASTPEWIFDITEYQDPEEIGSLFQRIFTQFFPEMALTQIRSGLTASAA